MWLKCHYGNRKYGQRLAGGNDMNVKDYELLDIEVIGFGYSDVITESDPTDPEEDEGPFTPKS